MTASQYVRVAQGYAAPDYSDFARFCQGSSLARSRADRPRARKQRKGYRENACHEADVASFLASCIQNYQVVVVQ
jgi:hypothetical protein